METGSARDSRIRVGTLTSSVKGYVLYLLTIDFVLATDLVSECAQFKSLENQNVNSEKVTQEVKSKECCRRKQSSKNLA